MASFWKTQESQQQYCRHSLTEKRERGNPHKCSLISPVDIGMMAMGCTERDLDGRHTRSTQLALERPSVLSAIMTSAGGHRKS
ncbi:hypothetical protein AAY473_034912 [Plecturocebus cupreus]